MAAHVTELDAMTGHPLGRTLTVPGGIGVNGLVASAGGLWLTTGSGMSTTTTYRTTRGVIGPDLNVHAGGGFPATVTPTRTAVWLGSTTSVACADPADGAARGHAAVPAVHHDAANIAYLIPAGGRVFAAYTSASPAQRFLISLRPPATCER